MSEQTVIVEEPTAEKKPRAHCPAKSKALCLVILVVILAVISYGYYHLTKKNRHLTLQMHAFKETLAKNQDTSLSLQKNIDAVQLSSQQIQAELNNQKQVMDELKQIKQGYTEAVVISEAYALVKLANANLQAGDDLSLVIRLLQSADQEIQKLNDANLLPLRKALAIDIAALQSVPQLDTQGLFLRLTALDAQVNNLPLPNTSRPQEPAQTNSIPAPDHTIPWWRRGLQQSLQAFHKMVVIRYNETGTLPLLSPDGQHALYQNLHANFSQIIWALLHKQPVIYKASLQQTALWIKTYFNSDSSVTLSMLDNLNQLQRIEIPVSPPQLASLQAFRNYK